MSSVTDKKLVVAFVKFLQQKMHSGQIGGDQAESLEVAVQCLESAFGVSVDDPQLQPSQPLVELFGRAEPVRHSPTDEEKTEAEAMKNEGNDLMQRGQYVEAAEKYTQAIRLYRSAVFYCNRAAAYSKLEKHELAVADCQTALDIDPSYGKAYGRMGLAFSCLNKFKEARDCYKKAVDLDPGNESLKANLEIAEQKLRDARPQMAHQQQQQQQQLGFDLNSLMSNPAMMNMASQFMTDPAMQNMMSSLVSGAFQQPGGSQGIQGLLEAGQRLASQMQQQNPDLVEQLRRQFQGQGGSGPQNPKPDPEPKNPPS